MTDPNPPTPPVSVWDRPLKDFLQRYGFALLTMAAVLFGAGMLHGMRQTRDAVLPVVKETSLKAAENAARSMLVIGSVSNRTRFRMESVIALGNRGTVIIQDDRLLPGALRIEYHDQKTRRLVKQETVSLQRRNDVGFLEFTAPVHEDMLAVEIHTP